MTNANQCESFWRSLKSTVQKGRAPLEGQPCQNGELLQKSLRQTGSRRIKKQRVDVSCKLFTAIMIMIKFLFSQVLVLRNLWGNSANYESIGREVYPDFSRSRPGAILKVSLHQSNTSIWVRLRQRRTNLAVRKSAESHYHVIQTSRFSCGEDCPV